MKPNELTIRSLILGALITTVFTAANVYLGLKVGLTFASSIPAAVISMAILSGFKDSSILENNIVQTVASAAGTLSAIIFVLPGLVIVGWWTGFPFWQSFFICLSGGVLGVVFTIPLRRALVTTSDLPYPEGVAAAEVLKVGSGTRGETKDDTGEAKEGLRAVILGSVASAGLAIVSATRVIGAGLGGVISLGGGASTGYDIAWSLALLGAGHLVGLSVGLAMLVGQVISWVIAVPILTHMQPAAAGVSLADHTIGIWRTQVRFLGAGTIAVAAVDRGAGGQNAQASASPATTSEIVLVGATTRIVKTTEADVKLSDLKVNDQITVVGTTDATGMVSATAIVVGSTNILGQLFGTQTGNGGLGGGARPSASPTKAP